MAPGLVGKIDHTQRNKTKHGKCERRKGVARMLSKEGRLEGGKTWGNTFTYILGLLT